MADGLGKFHCTYCQEQINGVRVKCAECTDFDICLKCFACGAEIGSHKGSHSYRLIDGGNCTVFGEPHDWRAREELLLLDAIEQYGYGNWDDIGKHVETRQAGESKDHYNELYIVGNTGKATCATETRQSQPTDHTKAFADSVHLALSPCGMKNALAAELTGQEQHELGYLPLRDDFECEFDNDAETLVSHLVLNYDDDDLDIAYKLAQVDMYSRRVVERKRRKSIAREYGLVPLFFAAAANKQKIAPVLTHRSTSNKRFLRDDRDIQERMRIFSQFHTSKEHARFFENLQREKDLKHKVKELIRLRKNGVNKIDDEIDSSRLRGPGRRGKDKSKLIVSPFTITNGVANSGRTPGRRFVSARRASSHRRTKPNDLVPPPLEEITIPPSVKNGYVSPTAPAPYDIGHRCTNNSLSTLGLIDDINNNPLKGVRKRKPKRGRKKGWRPNGGLKIKQEFEDSNSVASSGSSHDVLVNGMKIRLKTTLARAVEGVVVPNGKVATPALRKGRGGGGGVSLPLRRNGGVVFDLLSHRAAKSREGGLYSVAFGVGRGGGGEKTGCRDVNGAAAGGECGEGRRFDARAAEKAKAQLNGLLKLKKRKRKHRKHHFTRRRISTKPTDADAVQR